MGSSASSSSKARISLETFDLYQKVRDEEQVQTTSGATVSLVASVVCLILILSELSGWIFPRRHEHMVVDPVIEGKLKINFDITFHALTCAEVNLDAMDVAGEQQNGLDHDIVKIRLASDGSTIGQAIAVTLAEGDAAAPTPLPSDYCGSCYGAQSREGECCNTCEDVRNAYAVRGWDVSEVAKTGEQCLREKALHPPIPSNPGEGCRLTGHMLVNKVAGNFHVAMGETHTRGAGHIHQFNPMLMTKYNVSHTIHHMSFGEPYPGMKNPLDGVSKVILPPPPAPGDDQQLTKEGQEEEPQMLQGPFGMLMSSGHNSHYTSAAGVHMYYVKVIPTIFLGSGAGGSKATSSNDSNGKQQRLVTNQFSATNQFRPAIVNGQRQNILPGVFFVYDVSPFQVTVTEVRTPLLHVLTSTFAILGGILTLARLLDALLYQGHKAARSRMGVAFLRSLAGSAPWVAQALQAFGAGPLLGLNVKGAASGPLGVGAGQANVPTAPFMGTNNSTNAGGGQYPTPHTGAAAAPMPMTQQQAVRAPVNALGGAPSQPPGGGGFAYRPTAGAHSMLLAQQQEQHHQQQ